MIAPRRGRRRGRRVPRPRSPNRAPLGGCSVVSSWRPPSCWRSSSGSPPSSLAGGAPASAPPAEFSAARAMRTLEVIAAKPRPTGTPAGDEVRAYLVRELEALGFAVEVEDATSLTEAYVARWGIPVIAAHVRNVVARRRGTDSGPALLLMAHYDSRELTPGASDDGYGTATLLETARALASSPPLRHDVLLLFTEGEEQGAAGGEGVRRGEPPPPGGRAGPQLRSAGRWRSGPHVRDQQGRRRPSSTCWPTRRRTLRRRRCRRKSTGDCPTTPTSPRGCARGIRAMNFANVDGFSRYHQPTDTVARADLGTLQHHGAYALALARAFAADSAVVALFPCGRPPGGR